ncbi:MAG: peptidase M48 Ste24p [Methylococcaceae bacterium]|nr:peptidase M48 Ste24p [Methylococcaceae bacterium]
MIEVIFKPKKISLLFLAIIVFLTLVHSIVLVAFFHFDNPSIDIFVGWFDLDIEHNVPSTYSAFAILICSLLFFTIAIHKKQPIDYEKLCWIVLGIIFIFLSIDEYLQIHESIGDIVENHINATGFLYFPWVIPYAIAVIIFIIIYLKFILGLPKKTAVLFILSGTLYLTGAIVFDMLGGKEAELHGVDSISYCILYTIEEFLEMSAIVILMYTLLSYIEKHYGYISLSLKVCK